MLEDILVRQGVAYQVIGGPQFYERAEIKDAIAYLQVLDNPTDAVSLSRIANRPRRGVGDTSLARLQTFADGIGGSLWDALGRAEEVGLATASLRAVQSLRGAAAVADGAGAGRAGRRAARARARALGLPRGARGRAHDRGARAGSRTSRSSSASRASTSAHGRGEEPTLSQFLQEISLLLGPGRPAGRRARPGHADDAAQREGARVPRRLHARHGGRDLPALRSIEENDIEEERRLCYVGMTRAQGAADDVRTPRARSLYGRTDTNLPSRFLDELPAGRRRARAAAAGVVVELRRAALEPAAHRASTCPARDRRLGPPPTLGTGIVTRIEPDGVVTVRFEDGAERRLMLEYAPLEKV